MGLLKKTTSTSKLNGRKSTTRFPTRLTIGRRIITAPTAPAPPQIITSTPNQSHFNNNDNSTTAKPNHLTLNIPSNENDKEQEQEEQSSHLLGSSNVDNNNNLLNSIPYYHQQHREDAHLLGVHHLPHHHNDHNQQDDRFRSTRKVVSHSDLHSTNGSIPRNLIQPTTTTTGGIGGIHLSTLPSPSNSPAPSIHSGLPPNSFKDLAVLYQVVSERRTAFDNLLWQVPATSLTAHAFLFSISLSADTGRFARIASMSLCIVITVLTLHLFTRQLQAEDADHRWLADFEERHQIEYHDRAHGERWREYRAQKPAGAGRLGWLAMHRSYPLWSKGMLIIGFLAVAILILAIFDPHALTGYNCDLR